MADRGRSLHSGAGGGGGGPRIDYASLKAARRAEEDELDSKFGFDRFTEGPDRVGWLLNMRPVSGQRVLLRGRAFFPALSRTLVLGLRVYTLSTLTLVQRFPSSECSGG